MRLREEVREAAEREAIEIVTAARRDVRRIIVEARRQGGDVFSVTLRAENSALVQGADSGSEPVWTPLIPSPLFREHVSELVESIGMRIDAGVRVFRP